MRHVIGNPMERRKAERFAELLEAAEGGPRRHNRTSNDDELTSMVKLGESMQGLNDEQAAATAPDPGFQSQLRQRLMAVASVEGIGATAEPEPVPDKAQAKPAVQPIHLARDFLGGRRVAVAAAILVGALGVSGVSSASGAAVPGDTLYPIKRSTEQAQLAFAGSDVERGELHLEFAASRLAEASNLSQRPDEFREALGQMDDAVISGVAALNTAAASEGHEQSLTTVTDFIADAKPQLEALTSETSGPARESAFTSLTNLNAAHERTIDLETAMACASDPVLKSDELGPVPVDCAGLPGTGQGEQVPQDQPSDQAPESAMPSQEPTSQKPSSSPSESRDEPTSPDENEESDDGDSSEDSGGLLDRLTDLFSGLHS